VCPPPATGVAAAAALIAASEAFFAGALFTTGGFAAGFFRRCLGIGGVLATGRTAAWTACRRPVLPGLPRLAAPARRRESPFCSVLNPRRRRRCCLRPWPRHHHQP
jgi:hypothetical protein